MTDQVSAVDFDGDEAVAEAIAGFEEERSTRAGVLQKAGALAGIGGLASAPTPQWYPPSLRPPRRSMAAAGSVGIDSLG